MLDSCNFLCELSKISAKLYNFQPSRASISKGNNWIGKGVKPIWHWTLEIGLGFLFIVGFPKMKDKIFHLI